MSGSHLGGGLARPGTVNWPLLSGVIPQLADAHIPRHETGLGLAASLAPGDTAVLIPSDEMGRSLGGLGGPGQTPPAPARPQGAGGRPAGGPGGWAWPAPSDAGVA